MIKIVVLLVIFCCLYLSESQDVDYCNNLLNECRKFESTVGQYSGDIITMFNCYCNNKFQGKWSNVTRCELEAATCLVTLVGCLDITCQNIADVLNL